MITIDIGLDFDGPVLSAGLGTPRAVLDGAAQRDAAQSRIIPGTHLRGKLREALVELLVTADLGVDDLEGAERIAGVLFGRPDEPGAPRCPAALDVGALTEAAPTPGSLTTRVAIDPHTGTARAGALAFLEADAPGTRRRYSGAIRVPDGGAGGLAATELRELVAWLLAWLPAIGKSGTAGWGRVVERNPQPGATPGLLPLLRKLAKSQEHAGAAAQEADWVVATSSTPLKSVAVDITLQSPLVVGDGRARDNAFLLRYDIPGSVLRRALADVILEEAGLPAGSWVDAAAAARTKELRPLAEHFSEVEASFARWAGPEGPAIPWPTTSRWEKKGEAPVGDGLRALLGRGTAPGDCWANDSGSDWMRRNGLPRVLRAHVAMDRFTGAPRHGALFTMGAIAERDARGTPTRFHATLRCPKVAEPALRVALTRVSRLGKALSRGYGHVQLSEGAVLVDDWRPRLAAWNQHASAFEIPIMLTSDTLLLDAAGTQRLAPGMDLHAAYSAAWSEVLGVDVEAVLVFARHRLHGGATAAGPGALPPAVLTLPGSTFLLRCRAEPPVLNLVAERGVASARAMRSLATHWRRPIPFTTANGYGELLIAHPLHLEA